MTSAQAAVELQPHVVATLLPQTFQRRSAPDCRDGEFSSFGCTAGVYRGCWRLLVLLALLALLQGVTRS